jgi:hypothetical protein
MSTCHSKMEITAVRSQLLKHKRIMKKWHVDISPCFEQDLDELKIPLARCNSKCAAVIPILALAAAKAQENNEEVIKLLEERGATV